MAINEGGGNTGFGGMPEDPNKTRQNLLRYGSSAEVARDVQRQNMNNSYGPLQQITGMASGPEDANATPPPTSWLGGNWLNGGLAKFAPTGGGGTGMVPIGGPPQIPGMGPGGGYGSDVGNLEGLDFTKPGALEEYQRNHAGFFDKSSMSEDFARNALAQGAGPGVSNRADEAFNQFQSSTPANMDPYYDNERRKAEEAIRKTMAARGSYGSSATDDLYNEAYTNLAADAAKANAQYGLQRAGLMGSLAQGADQSSLAGSSDRRNWMNALSGVAGAGDAAGLSRIMAGGNLAGAAQGAQRVRGQDVFNNQLTMGDRMSGIMGQGYGDIFGTDLDLLKTAVGLNTGTATEGYNQATNNAQQQRQNVSNFNNLLGGNMQLAQGGYNLLNQPSTPGPAPLPTYNQNPNGEAELRRAWQYYP